MTTSVRSILPTDHQTNVSWVVELVIFNRGPLRLESFFKGSSLLKRLRKTSLTSIYFKWISLRWKFVEDTPNHTYICLSVERLAYHDHSGRSPGSEAEPYTTYFHHKMNLRWENTLYTLFIRINLRSHQSSAITHLPWTGWSRVSVHRLYTRDLLYKINIVNGWQQFLNTLPKERVTYLWASYWFRRGEQKRSCWWWCEIKFRFMTNIGFQQY